MFPEDIRWDLMGHLVNTRACQGHVKRTPLTIPPTSSIPSFTGGWCEVTSEGGGVPSLSVLSTVIMSDESCVKGGGVQDPETFSRH